MTVSRFAEHIGTNFRAYSAAYTAVTININLHSFLLKAVLPSAALRHDITDIMSNKEICMHHLIKLVRIGSSRSGNSMPAAFPASIHLSSHAIFLPSVRNVCKPSSSCNTCSGVFPCT